jgi:hypothetical protein
MRVMDDPVMSLFFVYPFVLAFAAAGVFDVVKGTLTGTQTNKGVMYGVLLFVIITIPGIFVMVSSMNYPPRVLHPPSPVRCVWVSGSGIILAKIWKI